MPTFKSIGPIVPKLLRFIFWSLWPHRKWAWPDDVIILSPRMTHYALNIPWKFDVDRLDNNEDMLVSTFAIHTGLFPLKIHGQPIGGNWGRFGGFKGAMTIRLQAFERAPRVASFALLITKIACHVCTQCFITSPIGNTYRGSTIGGLGAKWGKNFLIG